MRNAAVQHVLQSFTSLLEISVNDCSKIGGEIPIPTFDENVMIDLSKEASHVFQRMEMVVNLEGPHYIVGDLHGNIFDLIRIFAHASPPPESKFVFLGDYVDRGEYSIEVVALLFALVAAYPSHVTLLRGNHEFDGMNLNYGFHSEVVTNYRSDTVYNSINDAFSYMPLIAIVNKKLFCVHGGLSPSLTNLDQIKKIRRPLNVYEGELVSDLVWSDPSPDSKTTDKSNRGLGVTFGVAPLKEFLTRFGCTVMARAHQCVANGIQRFGNGLLYTVFSCSNYVDYDGNRCGLMYFGDDCSVQVFSLPALKQRSRSTANLHEAVRQGTTLKTTAKNSLALNIRISARQQVRQSGMRPGLPALVTQAIPRSVSRDELAPMRAGRPVIPNLRNPNIPRSASP